MLAAFARAPNRVVSPEMGMSRDLNLSSSALLFFSSLLLSSLLLKHLPHMAGMRFSVRVPPGTQLSWEQA